MNHKGKQAVIEIFKRIAFSGLVLLGAWLLLILLRGAIPDSLIDQINLEQDRNLSYDSSSWDWTVSIQTGEPVSKIIESRLGLTLQLIGLGALFSLVLAGILLSLGILISRVTAQPVWLAHVRSIVRLVIISGGASIPLFAVGILSLVLSILQWEWSPPVNSFIYWTVLVASILPAWLMVQSGHGELAKWPENTPYLTLAKHLGIFLLIRMLKLSGVIIVVTMFAGLGTFLGSIDFPVVFSVALIFAIIVTLAKLAADLIEIAYNHYGKSEHLRGTVEEDLPLRFAVPKGWLIFSFVLVSISILVAIVGPVLAPYGYNETFVADKLAPPSAQHLLGSDNVGRDVFSRVLYGIRIDVLSGLACAGIISGLAVLWAILEVLAKRAGNWLGTALENLLMLPREILCAFPWLVLLLIFVSLMMPNGIIMVILSASLVILPRGVAMIREAYQSLPERKGWLQNLSRTIPIVLLFSVASGIFYISTLSYNGYGIPPPTPELGGMLSGNARRYIASAPWLGQWPFYCLLLLLLTWVMSGEALLERFGFRSKAVWSKSME